MINMAADDTKEFMNFIEDWEPEAMKRKLGITEFKLLEKYKGMRFYDDAVECAFEVIPQNLEWKSKDKRNPETPGYVVICRPINEEEEDEDEEEEDGKEEEEEDDDEDDDLVSYHINDDLHRMIASPHARQFETIKLVAKE